MGSLIQDLARHYRMRAEEARSRAEASLGEEAKALLLRIACRWERMARYEELNNPQAPLWGKEEPS
jgi:hypothetical protein